MADSIVVTGGAGYVGSHVCKALAVAGYVPVAVDNLCRGFRAAVQWGPLEIADVTDAGGIADVLRRHRPRAVIHMAAFVNVGESVHDPDLYARNNVGGTDSVLNAMADTGVRHLVFSSSCAVYGTPDRVPMDETTPLKPENPYGASKLNAERLIGARADATGMSYMALRYFNAAGADPDAEIGENHDPETHLIPLAVRAAGPAGAELQIYGTDYDTDDGTAVRDYVHVTDLAHGHVAATRYLLEGGASETLNLGNGSGYSVRDIVAAVEAVTGRPVPARDAGRRAGDATRLIADTAKAQAVLGWQPRYSDLRTIITTAVRWEETRRVTLSTAQPA